MSIPRRSGRTSAAIPDFLVDKSEYVLGIEPDGRRKPEDLECRRVLFARLVRTAASHLNSAELKSTSQFLDSETERSRCSADLKRQEYASNDLFAFEVSGLLVHDAPAVQEYFSGMRQLQTGPVRQCLVCGELRPLVEKHPSIRLRGGISSGVALVSFNEVAFESYGWSRNENAPVCRSCADAYTTALTRLLSDRYPDPKHSGSFLARRSISLSSDTTAVYWAERESEILDLLGGLLDAPDANAVHNLLLSPHKGRESGGDTNSFYCVILSGVEGRAILRSAHRGSLEDVERCIKAYFRRLLQFVTAPMPLFALLCSLAFQGKAENLAPNLAAEIFLAILFGRPFPGALLNSALQRCRAEQGVPQARAALIGLYLTANL
ncbi:MAG TPA: type I-C CRISPR-associated protein Cas8c/Csd1, partial [Candidatus Angelobacter sp.]|nr:type I-C CRISPR-associated protein Cas8c/Csd1 [Candidatus Angelobacter sp.]